MYKYNKLYSSSNIVTILVPVQYSIIMYMFYNIILYIDFFWPKTFIFIKREDMDIKKYTFVQFK